MAKYDLPTGDNLAVKVWDEVLFRDMMKESYFNKFSNTSGTTLVHVKRNLEKQQGEKITFGLRMRLDKDFIVDGQSEGNEYRMTTYDYTLTLHKYRMPIRDNGELTRMRPPFNVTKEQRAAMVESAAEAMDKLQFTAVTGSPTRVFYSTNGSTPTQNATAATAKAALTTSSLIFPKLISYMRTWALTGGDRSQPPLRPIRVSGKNYLVLLVHPDCLYDLENDTNWQTAAREALKRGEDNPIFTHARYVYGGVIIHEHENIPIGTDAGTGGDVPWAECTLMGAQALAWAWGRRPKVVQREFDYGDEIGFDWSAIAATGKPVFNSLDYGSLGVYLARTQISDA